MENPFERRLDGAKPPMRAEIRIDNMASRRAFKRAGFTTKDYVHDWVIMERAC